METWLVLLALFTIILGMVQLAQRPKERSSLYVGLWSSAFLGGLAVLLGEYDVIPTAEVWMLLGVGLLIFSATAFDSLKRTRFALLTLMGFVFGVYVLPLIQFYLVPFPVALLGVYGSVILTVMTSYTLSTFDLSVSLQKLDKYSRKLLLPFSVIEGTARRAYGGVHIRELIFGGYLLFQTGVLVGLPLLTLFLTRAEILFYSVGVLLIAYIMFDWFQVLRASKAG